MSDSVWPHRRQPTRVPHPWDSPGKNTVHWQPPNSISVQTSFILFFFQTSFKLQTCSQPPWHSPSTSDPMWLELKPWSYSQSLLVLSVISVSDHSIFPYCLWQEPWPSFSYSPYPLGQLSKHWQNLPTSSPPPLLSGMAVATFHLPPCIIHHPNP